MNATKKTPTFGVVILGAGASSRMGQPKLLLPWRDTTVIGEILRKWCELGAAQVAVVHRPNDAPLAAELDRLDFPRADRIENPQPERGMFSSIVCAANWPGWRVNDTTPFQSGAKAAAVQTLCDYETSPNRAKRLDCGAFTAAFPPSPDASDPFQHEISHWAIVLGDQPHLNSDTLRQLLAFHSAHAGAICQPEFDGHTRHPVILPRPAFAELKHTRATTLKDFLKQVPLPRVQCSVSDVGMSLDMDTPEDYKRLKVSN